MTKEEAARKFVSMLTEQQCRDMLVPSLLATCPAVFHEIEKATTPNWQNTQVLNTLEKLSPLTATINTSTANK